MKPWLLIVLVVAAGGIAMGQAAEERFTRAVRPDDFSAAGLTKLSPEELARLDALVRAFKAGDKPGAAPVAGPSREARAVAAQTAPPRVNRPETPAAAPGLLERARVRLSPGTKVEYAPVESRIAGEFRGWDSRTIFTLENGQRWQVAGGESYVTPPEPGPAVTIRPGILGSFWMNIAGVRPRVKVVRVDGGP